MLNQPAAMSLALAVARPFLKSKFRRRIVALASPEELEARGVELAALPAALPAGEAGRWMEAQRTLAGDGGRCPLTELGG
jgi:hypothetical protein